MGLQCGVSGRAAKAVSDEAHEQVRHQGNFIPVNWVLVQSWLPQVFRCKLRRKSLGCRDSFPDRVHVLVVVLHCQHLPGVGLVALCHALWLLMLCLL